MMVRAQAQSLIQGLNTQIPTIFPHGEGAEGGEGADSDQSDASVMELS